MRSSSVKTTIAALTISLTLVAAAPSANARPAQRGETTVSERASAADRAFRAVQRFFRRFTGGVTANGGPSIPVPGTQGETPGSGIPTGDTSTDGN